MKYTILFNFCYSNVDMENEHIDTPSAPKPATSPSTIWQNALRGSKHPRFLRFTLLALAINLITWVGLYIVFPPTGDVVVLHYNIYFGVDLLGEWYRLLYIPITGTAVLILNAVFALYWQVREPVLAAITEFGSVVVQVLCAMALAALYAQSILG